MNMTDWMRLSAEKNAADYREVTAGCITTESGESVNGHPFLELQLDDNEILEEIDRICMFLLNYVYINGKKPPCMDIKRINP